LEYAVVLVVLAIVVAFALLIGFGAFAIHKMKPDWLKINAESRLARFSMEIGRSGKPAEPGQPHVPELPRGGDDRKELEA
jgi:hypothetical protein